MVPAITPPTVNATIIRRKKRFQISAFLSTYSPAVSAAKAKVTVGIMNKVDMIINK
jgi:DNA-binding sugar fermentation-stimulating protein